MTSVPDWVNKVLQSIAVAAILGLYAFGWAVNNRLTLLENSTDEQHTRAHAIIDCKLGLTPGCSAPAPTPDRGGGS